MVQRILLWLLAGFWVTMNVLLWRSEFGGSEVAARIPPSVVWDKILTAPDVSNLEITRAGKKIGFLRWTPTVGEELAEERLDPNYVPEGMVKQLTSYKLEIDGNLTDPELSLRPRFSFHLRLGGEYAWEEFMLQLTMRPTIWELSSQKEKQRVTLSYEAGDDTWFRDFTFEELRNPRALLQEFGGPLIVNAAEPLLNQQSTNKLSAGLEWEARNDWMKLGHSQVRVYRLQARLVERYQIVVIVSRVGEILQMELPGDIKLRNEELFTF